LKDFSPLPLDEFIPVIDTHNLQPMALTPIWAKQAGETNCMGGIWEYGSAMSDIQAIIDRMKENDEISRKFHEIETSILSILNFTDLFEILLVKIREKFNIPYVWLSLIEKSEVSSLIKTLESSQILKERMNIIDRGTLDDLLEGSDKPKLANTDLRPYYKLLPPKQKFFMKSLAVVPLLMDGKLIGSLNQADSSKRRFEPGIDTGLLERLALKVSLCLSNVTAHEKLKFMAYHDPLTGLLNRRVLDAVLKREFQRSKRYKAPLTLVFIDIDGFKGINDTYGHDFGDTLLKHFAATLSGICRECDITARYAGDEFVLVLPQTGVESAEKIMQRLKTKLAETPLEAADGEIAVAMSYGVCSTEDEEVSGSDPLSMLIQADKSLYMEKKRKKGLSLTD
jgi:diguanylate cyclase (GGDEF)-like protein